MIQPARSARLLIFRDNVTRVAIPQFPVGQFLDILGKVLSSRKRILVTHYITRAGNNTCTNGCMLTRFSKSLHFGARSTTSSRRIRFSSTRGIPTRSFEKVSCKRAHSNAYRALPHWRHACAWVALQLHGISFFDYSRAFLHCASTIGSMILTCCAKHEIFC